MSQSVQQITSQFIQPANKQWSFQTVKLEILQGGQDSTLHFYSKRFIDISIAILALLILLPVMAVVALAIKFSSPGPILFMQERVGARRRRFKNGEIVWEVQNFRVCKFRSMTHNADDSLHREHVKAFVNGTLDTSDASEHAKVKLNHDPRVTRVGEIIRKTSLDELPQLFNVLRGEMSLVGPRPVPTYEVDEYLDWHRERLATLPGITGFWQVKGRGIASFDEMLGLDIEYVRNTSLWLDIKILFLTIPAVFSGRGAN